MSAPSRRDQRAARAYLEQSVTTASPEKIVLLLYERATTELTRAADVLDSPADRHSQEVGQRLDKALAILGELRADLDHDTGGEIATNLDNVYDYCQQRIAHANGTREATPVREALGVLRPIEEAWRVVATS